LAGNKVGYLLSEKHFLRLSCRPSKQSLARSDIADMKNQMDALLQGRSWQQYLIDVCSEVERDYASKGATAGDLFLKSLNKYKSTAPWNTLHKHAGLILNTVGCGEELNRVNSLMELDRRLDNELAALALETECDLLEDLLHRFRRQELDFQS
jgi:hypothetical protein